MLSKVACALIACVTCSASLYPFVAPAGADQQVTALQHQAAQLSSEMLLEQLQIGGYEQQYDAALARVQQDRQDAAQTQGAIGVNQHRVGHDRTVLSKATVAAYEEGGSTAGVTPLFTDPGVEGNGHEYRDVLSGTVTDAVDQLLSDRQALRAKQATLQHLQAQDQASQDDAQQLVGEAQQTQQELQHQSAQVQGALAVAVAQQQAAAAAAAAVAVARARTVAAAASAPAGAGAPSGTADQPGTTGDPALNPFLQCVIQAESSGDYQAVSPTGDYMGAFQFSQPTWNEAANLAGLPTLLGVRPDQAGVAQQDTLAVALYSADGQAPWYDPCTGR
jgi:peptidoglycan hydrolase CwlO-like protein